MPVQSGGKRISFHPFNERWQPSASTPGYALSPGTFFECLECGEVFDSEEFRDMEIEENAETEQASEETEQAAGETESAAKRS
jgi:hypothetical protein